MSITIGQSGPSAGAAGSGAAGTGASAVAAAAVAQAQGAQSADVAALFGSLGLGTLADTFA